jgi:hypothetical protein
MIFDCKGKYLLDLLGAFVPGWCPGLFLRPRWGGLVPGALPRVVFFGPRWGDSLSLSFGSVRVQGF